MRKKFKILIIASCIFLSSFAFIFGQNDTMKYHKYISDFIDLIKKDKKEDIADLVTYPFKRQYPIPSIKSKQEFLNRFHEVFDDSLKQMIINSDFATNWSEVGWRGIMFNRGELWFDTDGRLIGVNYQSKFEKYLSDSLIEKDRGNVHPLISDFYKPVYCLETSKYKIRIDKLENLSYRFVSWPITKSYQDIPDIIIENGELQFEGSGSNHNFHFSDGQLNYICSIFVLKETGSPQATLTIFNGEKKILTQEAFIILK